MHDDGLDLENGPRSNVNMPTERPYATFYLLAIAIFALSITVSDIHSQTVHDLDINF